MKSQFIILIFVVFCKTFANAQQCHEIFRTRDRDIGRETYYGSVEPGNWYVSAAKQFYADSVPPNYYMLLYNKSKKRVDVYTRVSFGVIRLQLEDKSIISLDSVRYINLPSIPGGLAMKVYLTDPEMAKLKTSSLVRLYLKDAEIDLNKTKRAKFARIVGCLMRQ